MVTGHSSNYDEERRLLFSADEDFCKTSGSGTEKGFGYLRVWTTLNCAAPTRSARSRRRTPAAANTVVAAHDTIHNPLLVGRTLYISWYTDGIRVVDARDPRRLSEVAHFVPPAVNNPIQPSQRGVLTNATQVWGVAYDESRDLVFSCDMNSGLWILQRTDR